MLATLLNASNAGAIPEDCRVKVNLYPKREVVKFKNLCNTEINLKNWKFIANPKIGFGPYRRIKAPTVRYLFDKTYVQPWETVVLHTGSGTDNDHHRYMGESQEIFKRRGWALIAGGKPSVRSGVIWGRFYPPPETFLPQMFPF